MVLLLVWWPPVLSSPSSRQVCVIFLWSPMKSSFTSIVSGFFSAAAATSLRYGEPTLPVCMAISFYGWRESAGWAERAAERAGQRGEAGKRGGGGERGGPGDEAGTIPNPDRNRNRNRNPNPDPNPNPNPALTLTLTRHLLRPGDEAASLVELRLQHAPRRRAQLVWPPREEPG